jgi:hypothetical protein
MEDFIGIGQDLATGFGQLKATPYRAKEDRAEVCLEVTNLSADGLRGEIQLFCGAADATHLGNSPEISKVLEIQGDCSSNTEVLFKKIRVY